MRSISDPSAPAVRGLFGPRRWTTLDTLAALCILGTVPTVLMASDPGAAPGFRFAGIAFSLALLGLPWLALDLLARPLRRGALRAVAGAAMLALLALWWWAFRDAYMVPENSDPQNALIFVVLPLYGAAAAVAAGVTLRLLDRRTAP